jgi:hypothetical protein
MVPNGLIQSTIPFCSKFFINNPNSNPTIIPIKIFNALQASS